MWKIRNCNNYQIAKYAFFTYSIFALLSLISLTCNTIGLHFDLPQLILVVKSIVLELAPIILWLVFCLTSTNDDKKLRYYCKTIVICGIIQFCFSICYWLDIIPMTNNGMITSAAQTLTMLEGGIGLLSVIVSLFAGLHLMRKHTGTMQRLGIALVVAFFVWLICTNIVPVIAFYVIGNTNQTIIGFTNPFNAIANTLAKIYVFYIMWSTIIKPICR